MREGRRGGARLPTDQPFVPRRPSRSATSQRQRALPPQAERKEPPCPASPPPPPRPPPPARPPPARGPDGPGPAHRPRDPRLSAAEERTLAEAVARGDADARERFIRANLGLVTVIARQYRDKGLDLDDLIGEGHLGLIAAVERFDPAAGVRFGTYATYCIRTAIRDGLTRTASTIRLPAHVVGLRARWRKVERELGRELGHAPTAEQVAGALGLTASQREMIEQARRARGVRVGGGEPEDDAAWAPDERRRTPRRGPGGRPRRRTRSGG